LYRYSSNGVYYARFESSGKEIRRSLRTADRASAQRALAWLTQEREQVDLAQGKLTLAELCDRYLRTVQHQKLKTIERKTLIIRRIKLPRTSNLWISGYRFGPHSRILHMACIKRFFEMAGRDAIVSRSPAAHLRRVKPAKPIRATPALKNSKRLSKASAHRKTMDMMPKRARTLQSFSGWLA